jgi:hypothetical protein
VSKVINRECLPTDQLDQTQRQEHQLQH